MIQFKAIKTNGLLQTVKYRHAISKGKNMKNPRKIVLTNEMIKKHKLSTQPPPQNSLFWAMWNASEEIAQEALGTEFINGIKNGTLDIIKSKNANFSCFIVTNKYRQLKAELFNYFESGR